MHLRPPQDVWVKAKLSGKPQSKSPGNYGHDFLSIFRISLTELPGNMPPNPFTLDFAEGQGMALTMTFAHLEMLCIQWTATPPCNWFQDQKTLNHAPGMGMAGQREGLGGQGMKVW